MTQLFMMRPQLDAAAIPELPGGWMLRRATMADAGGLAGLLSESFKADWGMDRVRAELLEAGDVAVTWVMCDDGGGIRGTASERLMPEAYPEAGYVHFVAVAESARGCSLGRTLTLQCLNGFVARGLHSAVLETDDYRLPAIVTYLRLGFVPEYRSSDERTAWSLVLPTLVARTHPAGATNGAGR